MCLTLHLFNPWHDDALAAGSPYYNPSRFAARMSRALAALPAWWAAEGDVIACAEAPDAAWRQRTAGLLPEVRYETAPTLGCGVAAGRDARHCRRPRYAG